MHMLLILCNKAGCKGGKLKDAGALAQGKACNVAKSGDVGSLANYARDTLGTVDLWHAPLHIQFRASCTLSASLQGSSFK